MGDSIVLGIPKVDCGLLDPQNVLGKVLQIENDIYQIGTNHGIMKNWFSLADFVIFGLNFSGDIIEKIISLSEAMSMESKFGGGGSQLQL